MTVIAAVNVGNSVIAPCNGSGGSVIIGDSITCIFPLTGGTDNFYVLPTNGLTSSINTATGNGTCSVLNNGTAQANLSCVNIPSNGATAGTQNITVGGATKGSVVLVASTTGGVSCNPTDPCFLKTAQYEFSPKSSTSIFGDNDVTLTIKPGLFTTPAATGNKYVCRISLKAEGADDSNATLGYGAQTTRLSDGNGSTVIPVSGTGANAFKQFDYGTNGCVLKLTKDQQVLAKWYFKIVMAEVNGANALVASKAFQAEPSYFLLYGAIGSIDTSITPIK